MTAMATTKNKRFAHVSQPSTPIVGPATSPSLAFVSAAVEMAETASSPDQHQYQQKRRQSRLEPTAVSRSRASSATDRSLARSLQRYGGGGSSRYSSQRGGTTTATNGGAATSVVSVKIVGDAHLADDGSIGTAVHPLPKQKKNRCTVSLVLIFTLQCLLIIAAFAAMIAFAGVQTQNTSRALVEQSLASALAYAGSEVAKPFDSLEQLLVEYRARYQASGLITHNAYYPCDDRTGVVNGSSVVFSPSASFYSDMDIAMTGGVNSGLGGALVVSALQPIDWHSGVVIDADGNTESNITFEAVADRLSICSVRLSSIYRRFGPYHATTARFPLPSVLGLGRCAPEHCRRSHRPRRRARGAPHCVHHVCQTYRVKASLS